MHKVKFNGSIVHMSNLHIAKKGDKAWEYAWAIADEFGYLAPFVIECVPNDDDDEEIHAVDREDKCKAECVAIICSKVNSELFPTLTDDPRCKGFQFVYDTDEFEVL